MYGSQLSHPGAPTNSVFGTPVGMYADHKDKKMKKCNHRVIQIEKGTFAPLCFLITAGGMGPQEAGRAHDKDQQTDP